MTFICNLDLPHSMLHSNSQIKPLQFATMSMVLDFDYDLHAKIAFLKTLFLQTAKCFTNTSCLLSKTFTS